MGDNDASESPLRIPVEELMKSGKLAEYMQKNPQSERRIQDEIRKLSVLSGGQRVMEGNIETVIGHDMEYVLYHYHDGECGSWCKNPPWPFKPCRPTSQSPSPSRYGSPEASPVKESATVEEEIDPAMAKLMRNFQDAKPPRTQKISRLFELCMTPGQAGIKMDDFLEYLAFLSPSLMIERGIAKTSLNNAVPLAKPNNIQLKDFEKWLGEMETRLPEGFIDRMLAGSPL